MCNYKCRKFLTGPGVVGTLFSHLALGVHLIPGTVVSHSDIKG